MAGVKFRHFFKIISTVMKNHVFIIIVLLFFSSSCATDPGNKPIPKMVPDHTPYIAGLIEASPDTTHHYPEIVVGYFTDIYTDEKDPFFSGVLREYPGIYSPTLLRQVVQTSILFGLAWAPESKAKVIVNGPLGTPQEQTVNFTHEGNGVYGDKDYALPRIPQGKYRLRVTLPDGRTYGQITQIPEATDIPVPDSISVPVEYRPYYDGTPKEEHTKQYNIIFDQPDDSYFTIIQYNSELDRDLLLLEPDERFKFTDRSNYWRTGIGYAGILNDAKPDTFKRGWVQSLNKPRDEVWMINHWWFRFSFFDEGIGDMFSPLKNIFTTADGWVDQFFSPRGIAAAQNDSTYLFRVSTIRKVGGDGEFLPKEESDAIGFFSGYYSRYKQTTLYPIRNFDLDSVLTANEQE